jgi:hypothetical protein
MQSSLATKLQAALFALVGLFVLMIALGVFETQLHAPRLVIACVGLAFTIAGVSILVRPGERLGRAAGAIILICFGSVCAWAALHPEKAQVIGAPGFLPHDTIKTIAQIAIGLIAAVCYLFAIALLVRAIRH